MKQECLTLEPLALDFGRVSGTVDIIIEKASKLKNMDLIGKSDPFVECFFSSEPANKIKTIVKENELEPIWNQQGSFFVETVRLLVQETFLTFQVYDDDTMGA